MSKVGRRTAATPGVAASVAAAMSPPGAPTSQRTKRLRVLYANLDDPVAQAHRTDADLNAICDEIYAISDAITDSPAPGLVGIIERAMAVYYWYREGGTAYTPGDVSDEAVRALVKAVTSLDAGGAHG
jgi:hypothetical protein